MNLVTFSGYWRNYSRLLFHQDGIKIEISMTPPPPTTRGWDNIAEQRVQVHTTSSKGDKIMGINFMPESAVTLMRGYLGETFTQRLCEFDYLGEMMRIFNTQDVDVLRDHLRVLPCNGGIKWEDIIKIQQTALFNEIVNNGVLTGVSLCGQG